jgi:exonuclease VII small subunit
MIPKKMFYLILFIVSVALLNSCYTEKKAVKQVQKAVVQYPDTTRSIFRARYPLIITNSPTDSADFKKYLAEIDSITAELEEEKNKFPLIDTFPLFVEDIKKIEILQKNLFAERVKFNKLSSSYLELKKVCKGRPPLRDTIKIADNAAIEEAYYITGQIVSAKDKELQEKEKELAKVIEERDKAQNKVSRRNKVILILSISLAIFLIPIIIRIIAKRVTP